MWTIEELSNELRALVQIESPYFHEHRIMEYAVDWFQQRGLPVKRHIYRDDVITGYQGENIIVEIDGEPGGPTICLNGHLDTVPLCNGWTRPPFAGQIEGDRLYGVGAADMKSGCVAMMLAADKLAHSTSPFYGKLLLTLVSVEEGPFGLGTNAIIEDGLLEKIDCTLSAEPSGAFLHQAEAPLICLGARGNYVYHVDFYGTAAHAAHPEEGQSAAEAAAKFIVAATARQPQLQGQLGAGSLCVLEVHADGGACSVPDSAKVVVMRHVNELESREQVLAEAAQFCEQAGVACRYEIYVRKAPSEGCRSFQPYVVPRDNPFAQKLHQAVCESSGKQPCYQYFSSIGDFNFLATRCNGAPCLLYGAAGGNIHAADEWVSLSSLQEVANGIYSFLQKSLVRA